MCWLFFGVIDVPFRRFPPIGLFFNGSFMELSVDATPSGITCM
jgi:hypothetical protein